MLNVSFVYEMKSLSISLFIGANQIPVAMPVVDTAYHWPESVLTYTALWKHNFSHVVERKFRL